MASETADLVKLATLDDESTFYASEREKQAWERCRSSLQATQSTGYGIVDLVNKVCASDVAQFQRSLASCEILDLYLVGLSRAIRGRCGPDIEHRANLVAQLFAESWEPSLFGQLDDTYAIKARVDDIVSLPMTAESVTSNQVTQGTWTHRLIARGDLGKVSSASLTELGPVIYCAPQQPSRTGDEFQLNRTTLNEIGVLIDLSATGDAFLKLMTLMPLARMLIRTILVCPRHPSYRQGGSTSAFPGLCWIDSDPAATPSSEVRYQILQLAHEAIHSKLNLLERSTNISGDGQIEIYSPWRQTRRPLRQVVHAAATFSVMSQASCRLLQLEDAISADAESVDFASINTLKSLDLVLSELSGAEQDVEDATLIVQGAKDALTNAVRAVS